jgi:capsular polysaccharide biosynthesis protein
MRTLTHLAIFGIAFFVPVYQAHTQVLTSTTTPEEVERKFELSRNLANNPTYLVQAPSDEALDRLKMEDERRDQENQPYRFAKLIETDITTENAGTWNIVNEQLVWN